MGAACGDTSASRGYFEFFLLTITEPVVGGAEPEPGSTRAAEAPDAVDADVSAAVLRVRALVHVCKTVRAVELEFDWKFCAASMGHTVVGADAD